MKINSTNRFVIILQISEEPRIVSSRNSGGLSVWRLLVEPAFMDALAQASTSTKCFIVPHGGDRHLFYRYKLQIRRKWKRSS